MTQKEMPHKRGTVRRKSDIASVTIVRGCCELNVSSGGKLHNAGCPVEEACANYRAAVQALSEVIAMLDASSFGGHKLYRCLTPAESARLDEIRLIAEGK